MTTPIEIIITNDQPWLGYITALQRIQTIAQEHVRRQVEAYGAPRDAMDAGKADLEAKGAR